MRRYSRKSAIRKSISVLGRRQFSTENAYSVSASIFNRAHVSIVIRTSGEMRVSNFLLWQIAYAEIFVTETLWPDFNRARLLEALLEYQKRERRYGGIHEGAPSDEKPARAAGN